MWLWHRGGAHWASSPVEGSWPQKWPHVAGPRLPEEPGGHSNHAVGTSGGTWVYARTPPTLSFPWRGHHPSSPKSKVAGEGAQHGHVTEVSSVMAEVQEAEQPEDAPTQGGEPGKAFWTPEV